ncbi:MAG TPA: hypothetical protein VK142_07710 [Bacillota bacterium]|nr:hypothetical protein [Bacillota bacterium]
MYVYFREPRPEKTELKLTKAGLAGDIPLDPKHIGRIERGEIETGSYGKSCTP